MATPPTRIADDVYEAAQSAAASASRSVAQQISHWARIGRELESAPDTNLAAIEDVLSGRASYDLLHPREQAAVRVEWDARADELRANLNLEEEFVAAGQSWSEADSDGNLVQRFPNHRQ